MKHLMVTLTAMSAQKNPLHSSKLGQMVKKLITGAIFWWLISAGLVITFIIRKQNETENPLNGFEQRYILLAMLSALVGIIFLWINQDEKYRKTHPKENEPRWLNNDGSANF